MSSLPTRISTTIIISCVLFMVAPAAADGALSDNLTKDNICVTQNIVRDNSGRIARSYSAKREFKKLHPCPSTGKSSGSCPGYIIDHIKPLKRCGADAPANMQWQTIQEARDKDRIE